MSLDFTDRKNFQEWRDAFMNALSGSAAAGSSEPAIVRKADGIAQLAVLLIQERARESEK
jgi:hypothetical protein